MSRREDRGDGLLIIGPPGIPTAQVIERLVMILPRELKRHNRIYSGPARIQLRVAVTVGPVEKDSVGVAGRAIIQASRMLDAPAFKQAIADQAADRAAELGGEGGGDGIGVGGGVVHPPARPVAVQAVGNVEVLLEVVAQREVQERPPVRRQLHAGGQAALHDREVAGGQVPVELRDERADLQAVVGGEAGRVDAWPGDHDHAQRGDGPLG